ncbi:deoxyribonuclease IV [Planctomycetota bacterium]
MAARARRLLLGAHMSIQGGLHRAIERGEKVGCTALQLFTRNNLQWVAPPLAADAIARFRDAWAASSIGPIVAHANYLINLASPDRTLRRRSLDGLLLDLRRAAAMGVPWLILHPGNHMGAGEEAGLRRVADLAARALDAIADLPVGLLLENTAGQGTALGHRFEHLAWLLDAIDAPAARLGICLDTCHLHAAGYDLRTPRAYRRTLRDFDRLIGLSRLHAIHVNDAKGPLGSRLDRHAHIGRGTLGLAAFRSLLRDRRLRCVPKVIETPKKDERRKDWDNVNLRRLRRLVTR